LMPEGTNRCPSQGLLMYIHAENYDFRSEDAGKIEQLVVWGGEVANRAEDDLSKVVDRSAGTLRSVTYCPDRTKGGVLVRPKYYRGDRGGEQVFPQLTDLAIRLEPVLLPREYGWITPGLRHLRLLCMTHGLQRSRDEYGGKPDFRLPNRRCIQAWLGQERQELERQSLPQELLASCPNLESITIALAAAEDEDYTGTDWFLLLPAKPVPWSVHRLLLLAVLKPSDSWATVAQSGGPSGADGTPAGFSLSNLNVAHIDCILTFLGRPRWMIQDLELPAAARERLGLSEAFCNVSSTEIIQDPCSSWEQAGLPP